MQFQNLGQNPILFLMANPNMNPGPPCVTPTLPPPIFINSIPASPIPFSFILFSPPLINSSRPEIKMLTEPKPTTLFAAVTTIIPTRFRDASYTRRVPYNQEVFVDSMHDESLVFEVNELNENVPDEKSAEHFLKELGEKMYAGSNFKFADSQGIQNCVLKNQIPNVVVNTSVGNVEISKRKGKGVQNSVKIYLANIRLKDPKYKTDVIITAYKPVLSDKSSQQSGHQVDEMDQIFREAVSNFKVTDWSFFTEDL